MPIRPILAQRSISILLVMWDPLACLLKINMAPTTVQFAVTNALCGSAAATAPLSPANVCTEEGVAEFAVEVDLTVAFKPGNLFFPDGDVSGLALLLNGNSAFKSAAEAALGLRRLAER